MTKESKTDPLEEFPVAPTLTPALRAARIPPHSFHVSPRILLISFYAVIIGVLASVAAYALTLLIDLITNLSFFGRWAVTAVSPENHALGLWVILVPVAGALIIGLMARYGSAAIRGHGIPEAMERVLLHESKIPVRLTFLKPLSAAISIGTGGPFGAEGPIIATGGALGSLWGQLAKITDNERRTLLASGAAAGLAATFASPIASVLLAVELLLFEYRSRSIIPVALAAVTAQAVRTLFFGMGPVFPMESVIRPEGIAFLVYAVVGLLIGLASVGLTQLVHWIEDAFEKLPVHWMWHPAIGALVVGIVGYFDPRVFGVGYHYIEQTLSGDLAGQALLILGAVKFITWTIYVGSGTSGGTLAPMFIMGGAAGTLLGVFAERFFPGIGVDHRIAALVGMTAIFAGASRAFLASVILALETTHQPLALIPVFVGCTTSYLVSCFLMPASIMTEKMRRQGIPVPEGFGTDFMAQMIVKDHAVYPPIVLQKEQTVESARQWLDSGQAGSQYHCYPVVEADKIVGVLSRRDIWKKEVNSQAPLQSLIQKHLVCVYEDETLRAAVDLMAIHDVGRLPVVTRENPDTIKGILTRNDILKAYSSQLRKNKRIRRVFRSEQ